MTTFDDIGQLGHIGKAKLAEILDHPRVESVAHEARHIRVTLTDDRVVSINRIGMPDSNCYFRLLNYLNGKLT